jgi:hypothetical protein
VGYFVQSSPLPGRPFTTGTPVRLPFRKLRVAQGRLRNTEEKTSGSYANIHAEIAGIKGDNPTQSTRLDLPLTPG